LTYMYTNYPAAKIVKTINVTIVCVVQSLTFKTAPFASYRVTIGGTYPTITVETV
jgi:hypothetical protein